MICSRRSAVNPEFLVDSSLVRARFGKLRRIFGVSPSLFEEPVHDTSAQYYRPGENL